jgi:hypothetical protein
VPVPPTTRNWEAVPAPGALWARIVEEVRLNVNVVGPTVTFQSAVVAVEGLKIHGVTKVAAVPLGMIENVPLDRSTWGVPQLFTPTANPLSEVFPPPLARKVSPVPAPDEKLMSPVINAALAAVPKPRARVTAPSIVAVLSFMFECFRVPEEQTRNWGELPWQYDICISRANTLLFHIIY